MGETLFGSVTPATLLVGAILIGCIVLAAVKIIWGVTLWSRKSNFRVGERWGGETGEVSDWSGGAGYVQVGGELWKAISPDPLQPGDKVAITRTKGLTIEVRKQ